ncbi:hypothetical protein [Fangia hongkongensis]|uniref:hypothetical protein n=1 Tax=Fangia hongkongensis TaxID=270495 RepID=UPI00036DC234|nr:hypothetical protein [Fangia hongkongensis]MBK2125672.1 hypothetical protein [Fangia hongkongensis]
MCNKAKIFSLLSSRLKEYDAIIIGEDKEVYISGMVPVVHEANINHMLPIYIARTTSQLGKLKSKLDGAGLRVFYILDNRYTIEEDEPTGQELIDLWHIENDCVLVTSSYLEISTRSPIYPVFDKLMPTLNVY